MKTAFTLDLKHSPKLCKLFLALIFKQGQRTENFVLYIGDDKADVISELLR